MNIRAYEELATKIRVHALRMTHNAQSSHIGSCLSIADILAVLYGGVLNVKPEEPNWENRDRFILSKGHACAVVYAVLAECGFFPLEWLDSFYQNGSELSGHISHKVSGVEVSTGSLGHGLSIGCGMALAGKRDNKAYRVFVLLSEGDCDEGSTWEAAMFASHHKLDNLVVIIDYNKLQALGQVEDILRLEPLADKWRSFGWSVVEIDGHNYDEIYRALRSVSFIFEPFRFKQPTCIIVHTIKGKGVSFMENQVAWHYKFPNDEELMRALEEIK